MTEVVIIERTIGSVPLWSRLVWSSNHRRKLVSSMPVQELVVVTRLLVQCLFKSSSLCKGVRVDSFLLLSSIDNLSSVQ
jgi:hypothetical protein